MAEGGPGEDKRGRCCNKTYPRKRLITCFHCKEPYHTACINITTEQLRHIPQYACRGCRGVGARNREPAEIIGQEAVDFNLCQHLMTCKSNLSIISNIPRGARVTAANALIDLINEVVESNAPLSWSKLFCFTYHALQKPKNEKKSNSSGPSLVTKIKNQT